MAQSWEGNNACQNWQFVTCEQGNVIIVNFGKQGWMGSISPSFSKLTNLKQLLLNDNKLTGRIPASLTSLKHLETLDVSNNNLSGKVPEFASSVTVKTSGNPFIGKELDGGDSSVSTVVIVVFVTVFLAAIAAGGFVVYKRRLYKKTNSYKLFNKGGNGRNSDTVVNIDPLKDNPSAYNSNYNQSPAGSSTGYEGANITIPFEVLREATENFKEENVLGRGGFGVVYRGQLHDGMTIAVKRMESSMMGDKGLTEFKAEIEVLTKVRHRHLVALHGFCNTSCERLLVYEYMPQGCLGQHLFQWKEMGVPPLSWNQRVMIALDVARGIEYLHSMAQQSFIHRDLKPSNILLGDDLRAKVSDFGLVRSAPDGNYSIETKLAGTFGYLAPEYAATGRVTTKVDVYAFGVVLMELITGRKALDGSLPDEQIHLVTWFRSLLQDKDAVRDAMDPVLLEEMDAEMFQNIWKVVELAGYCTAREANQRPDMSHSVNMLSSLVDIWKPSPERMDSFDIDIHMSLPQALQKWKASEGDSSTLSTGFFTGDTTNHATTTSDTTATNIKSHKF
ncbi:receptor-like kinase TMK4 [Andrographis paniculata]|uniref:receptor-like kinase TMK4 n=1 Tax=Andrographis paniculata TaxID=175694 RepID=UPI0021E7861C|nr:receptor-like kinase TMK4 [Andrographis paniculata]